MAWKAEMSAQLPDVGAVRQSPDLYIIGCGIIPERDITLETKEVLSRSTSYCVFGNPNIRPFLDHHRFAYVDLSSIYRPGKRRSVIYHEAATRIVDAAQRSPPVSYLTYGHPTMLDDIAAEILLRSGEFGLSAVVLPGVSFIDWLLAKRPLAIGRVGLRLLVADALVSESVSLDARVPTFIAQIVTFASHEPTDDMVLARRDFDALTDRLLRHYPPDHMVTICDLGESGDEPVFIDLPLCTWTLAVQGLTYATTLYVPPYRP
jgi:uncharacterized protein YabN with tetrapyrrole methylase and pyrophosphatase domain